MSIFQLLNCIRMVVQIIYFNMLIFCFSVIVAVDCEPEVSHILR